ncbi:MAG: hypothetical protein HYY06_07180 [Deltaproteobacteria bacterium]|nr:hypothetical protein [Deltaproteobacteria bacterium]
MREGCVIRAAAVFCLPALLACPSSLGPGPPAHRNDAGQDAGPDPCDGVQCPGGQVCSAGACIRLDQCEGIDCAEEGTVCSYGSCVSRHLDEDGDGSPASDDCDDRDSTVAAGSVRSCETSCAEGLSTCIGGEWQDCSAPTECDCEPGEERVEACGSCGEATRACGEGGAWGALGPCGGESECPEGATGVRPCDVGGDCSNQSRLCGPDCRWGEWGSCEEETQCDPRAIDVQECGMCGSHQRSCGAGCLWGAFDDCVGEGECQAGARQLEDCGDCGTRIRECSSSCVWSEWGSCGGEGPCTPGDLGSQTCGNCGSQSRTCTASCTWGSWETCTGQGICQAGEQGSRACGDCGGGLQTRTCTADCMWGMYGTCDAAQCGALEEPRDCGIGGQGGAGCGTQTRSCAGTCIWTVWGACEKEPARENDCDDGNLCTDDACGDQGNCSSTNACEGDTPVCCGAATGCRECCGNDATTCPGSPGTCRDWACGAGSCVTVNGPNGTDPELECNGRGGLDICCNGICRECCGADTSTCGLTQTCHTWVCQAGVCVDTLRPNGYDDCALEGTTCCDGRCAMICGS